MKKSRLLALVGILGAANIGLWALTGGPLQAAEVDMVKKDCWWTVLTMGCSTYFQQGCVDVSDCSLNPNE